MASSDNNNDKSSGNSKASDVSTTTNNSKHVVPDELDLDKNPIKYATHEKGKFELEPHDKPYMELTLRSGEHGEIAQKILRQRIEQRAKEFPRWPGDSGSGVRVLWIESRFWYDRERLGPDFDQDWREYRAKYIHSLNLDPREPVHVPEYEKALINPIRRFYMKGGDWLENNIIKKFARDRYYSSFYRVQITRGIMAYFAAVGIYYWLRYTNKKWDSWFNGPMLFVSSPRMFPGHPKYPFENFRTEPGHHADNGFTRRNIYKDLRDYEDRTVIL